ncbi:MAG: hypothetical protein OXC19_07635 [Bryobacterales bacterium]|nr:hypothetical protein [Bryobacterales bacterium]
MHHLDVLRRGLDKQVHRGMIRCAGGFFFTNRRCADFAYAWAAMRADLDQ